MCPAMLGMTGAAVGGIGKLIGNDTMEKAGGYISNPASAVGDAIGGKTGKKVSKVGNKALQGTKLGVKF